MTEIKPGMEIFDCRGQFVGSVDEVFREGYVKMTRRDSSDGQHHFFPVNLIERVEADVLILDKDRTSLSADLLDALPESEYARRALN